MYAPPGFLKSLNRALRIQWFNEGCYHAGMFYKKISLEKVDGDQVNTAEYCPSQEEKLDTEAVRYVKEVVVDPDQGTGSEDDKKEEDDVGEEDSEDEIESDDDANGETCKRGWIKPGNFYWAKQPSGKFWVSVVVPEGETGISCRRYHEDKTKSWPQLVGQTWHVVYLGRSNRRAWIHLKDMECFRDGFDDVRMPWSTAGGKNPAFDIDEEDREAWTAAVNLANELKDLRLKERLRRLEELGLRTDGELDAEESYTEYLVGRYGKEKTEEIFASFEEDKEVHKWGHKYAYEQKLKDDRAEAEKLSRYFLVLLLLKVPERFDLVPI